MTKETDKLKNLLTSLKGKVSELHPDPYFTVLASTTKKSTPYGLMEIREALKTQETKAPTLTELVFKNGMEFPIIETAVKPAMNDGILACPNEDCTEEPTHIHPGTIIYDDRNIYIPFTCEHCRFTFRLDFTYKDGTMSLKWNKSLETILWK